MKLQVIFILYSGERYVSGTKKKTTHLLVHLKVVHVVKLDLVILKKMLTRKDIPIGYEVITPV